MQVLPAVRERMSSRNNEIGFEMKEKDMNYSKLLQGILDIAEEMLVAGAEVSRVEDSVERMCSAYGCDRVNVFVITSNIQVTMEDPDGEIVTQIRRVVRNDVNFDRLDFLNDLSICGLATVVLNLVVSKLGQNPLANIFIVSFAAGILSVITVWLGIGVHTDKIMIGVIMLLIPGIAMTNGVRDMLTGDIATGMLRVANALLLAIAIACGFALSLFVTGGGLI